jgi:nucleotide-binding universal stress UspA family protein
MSLIRKILVPIDFSPCSQAAVYYAGALAEELGASLEVVHIESDDAFKIGSTTPSAPDALQDEKARMDKAMARVQQSLGERVTRRTERGDPLQKILELAGSAVYDLIVLGTHGRIGRLHALVGSVAEGVVRNAPCPVLTVRVASGEAESFADRLRGGTSVGER